MYAIVLTSNEFRQLEIQNGEVPQSPFLWKEKLEWRLQVCGKWTKD